jgi:hypothetical protein
MLAWFFYLLGRQLTRSVFEAWLRYGIILAVFSFVLLLLFSPLGPLLDRLEPITGESEPVFHLGLGKLAKAGLTFLTIVVPGFIGASTARNRKDAISE